MCSDMSEYSPSSPTPATTTTQEGSSVNNNISNNDIISSQTIILQPPPPPPAPAAPPIPPPQSVATIATTISASSAQFETTMAVKQESTSNVLTSSKVAPQSVVVAKDGSVLSDAGQFFVEGTVAMARQEVPAEIHEAIKREKTETSHRRTVIRESRWSKREDDFVPPQTQVTESAQPRDSSDAAFENESPSKSEDRLAKVFNQKVLAPRGGSSASSLAFGRTSIVSAKKGSINFKLSAAGQTAASKRGKSSSTLAALAAERTVSESEGDTTADDTLDSSDKFDTTATTTSEASDMDVSMSPELEEQRTEPQAPPPAAAIPLPALASVLQGMAATLQAGMPLPETSAAALAALVPGGATAPPVSGYSAFQQIISTAAPQQSGSTITAPALSSFGVQQQTAYAFSQPSTTTTNAPFSMPNLSVPPPALPQQQAQGVVHQPPLPPTMPSQPTGVLNPVMPSGPFSVPPPAIPSIPLPSAGISDVPSVSGQQAPKPTAASQVTTTTTAVMQQSAYSSYPLIGAQPTMPQSTAAVVPPGAAFGVQPQAVSVVSSAQSVMSQQPPPPSVPLLPLPAFPPNASTKTSTVTKPTDSSVTQKYPAQLQEPYFKTTETDKSSSSTESKSAIDSGSVSGTNRRQCVRRELVFGEGQQRCGERFVIV